MNDYETFKAQRGIINNSKTGEGRQCWLMWRRSVIPRLEDMKLKQALDDMQIPYQQFTPLEDDPSKGRLWFAAQFEYKGETWLVEFEGQWNRGKGHSPNNKAKETIARKKKVDHVIWLDRNWNKSEMYMEIKRRLMFA